MQHQQILPDHFGTETPLVVPLNTEDQTDTIASQTLENNDHAHTEYVNTSIVDIDP